MITSLTAADLAAFEEWVAQSFNDGRIPYPVHLESGNEDQLLDVFTSIHDEDWVCVSWRGHLKALLKGVPHETLKAAIMRGESMALSFPKYRVFGSAIAGGMIPIALGVALGIKRDGGAEKVWCFLGDMASYMGIFLESLNYAEAHDLPIHFIIEDNGLSVCTPTKEVWNGFVPRPHPRVTRYEYHSKWPHCGAGVRVEF